MNRRTFIGAGVGALVGPWVIAQQLHGLAAQNTSATRWNVYASEGLDAVAFLGALSGGDLYVREYSTESATFGARLPGSVRDDLSALLADADRSGFGLLWPNLANMLSGTEVSTIDAVIRALETPADRILPAYRASTYWDQSAWDWLSRTAPRLRAVFAAIREAGFGGYRNTLVGNSLERRAGALREALTDYDVVQWQRKLTGRSFDPAIDVVLLYFSRPHGVKVQGQRFLQSPDFNVTTTLRIAAHELLHPPVTKDSEAEQAALRQLAQDDLIMRIVRDHDRRWGYSTAEGYLNEDLCQALDQLIIEQLGAARHPADRWRNADDGMHVLAAGLYGLLRQDKWAASGGDIERWLEQAATSGRLAPDVLHAVAARILERPVDRLWPLVP